jgi:hypothetical protein
VTTFTTSFLVIGTLFVLKFFVSVKLGIIRNRFGLYLISNITLSVMATVLIWIVVDIIEVPASVATAAILLGIFIIR